MKKITSLALAVLLIMALLLPLTTMAGASNVTTHIDFTLRGFLSPGPGNSITVNATASFYRDNELISTRNVINGQVAFIIPTDSTNNLSVRFTNVNSGNLQFQPRTVQLSDQNGNFLVNRSLQVNFDLVGSSSQTPSLWARLLNLLMFWSWSFWPWN